MLGKGLARSHRIVMILGLLVLVLSAVSCYNNNTGDTGVLGFAYLKLPAFPETGSHAVIVFSEMHYSPAYKVQEGPRLLPPEGSIAIGGPDTTDRAAVELSYTAEEYVALKEPEEYGESYDASKAKDLYTINCAVCHGENLKGDGAMKDLLTRGAPPPNLAQGTAAKATEGELFAWISYGSRTGFTLAMNGQANPTVMPEFRMLLTEEDRWHLVRYILGEQGR